MITQKEYNTSAKIVAWSIIGFIICIIIAVILSMDVKIGMDSSEVGLVTDCQLSLYLKGNDMDDKILIFTGTDFDIGLCNECPPTKDGELQICTGHYVEENEEFYIIMPPDPTYDLVEMEVTAYCPCELCCGKFADGITASGKPAEGFLVAAPPKYAFYSLMSIEGYNEGREVPVYDRGGAIKGNKLDLLFESHQDALDWGEKTLKVKVWK